MGKQLVAVAPRCLNRQQTAIYLGVSIRQVDRLIQMGTIPIIKLRVESNGQRGTNRRVLIDVRDLDALVDQSKIRERGSLSS